MKAYYGIWQATIIISQINNWLKDDYLIFILMKTIDATTNNLQTK